MSLLLLYCHHCRCSCYCCHLYSCCCCCHHYCYCCHHCCHVHGHHVVIALWLWLDHGWGGHKSIGKKPQRARWAMKGGYKKNKKVLACTLVHAWLRDSAMLSSHHSHHCHWTMAGPWRERMCTSVSKEGSKMGDCGKLLSEIANEKKKRCAPTAPHCRVALYIRCCLAVAHVWRIQHQHWSPHMGLKGRVAETWHVIGQLVMDNSNDHKTANSMGAGVPLVGQWWDKLREGLAVCCLARREKGKHAMKVTWLRLRHKLHSPNSDQSDLITIIKYRTFAPRTLCLLQPWSNNNGQNHCEDDATVTMTMTWWCDHYNHNNNHVTTWWLQLWQQWYGGAATITVTTMTWWCNHHDHGNNDTMAQQLQLWQWWYNGATTTTMTTMTQQHNHRNCNNDDTTVWPLQPQWRQ